MVPVSSIDGSMLRLNGAMQSSFVLLGFVEIVRMLIAMLLALLRTIFGVTFANGIQRKLQGR